MPLIQEEMERRVAADQLARDQESWTAAAAAAEEEEEGGGEEDDYYYYRDMTPLP